MPWVIRAFCATFGAQGWEMRVHHDDQMDRIIYGDVLQALARQGVLKLVNMGKAETLCGSMLWRLHPIFDPTVSLVAARDVDSLPMDRDLVMLDYFEKSSSFIHAILDSESHCGPLMGGMIAIKPAQFRATFPEITAVKDLLTAAPTLQYNNHGDDQLAMNQVIWPRTPQGTLIHQVGEIRRYPTARETQKVAPKVTEMDRVVNHIGAGFSIDRLKKALEGCGDYPNKELIETTERELGWTN